METNNEPQCESKHKQFCTGKDVRLVQDRWTKREKSYRGAIRFMCKGCRELHHGHYRYVTKI